MKKELLVEDFVNASKEYTDFCNAMCDRFEDDPIMSCLIGNLNRLANEYYMAIVRIYENDMTLDEVIHIQKGA